MPIRIVDDLEKIKVDDDERDRFFMPSRIVKKLMKTRIKVPSVEYAGSMVYPHYASHSKRHGNTYDQRQKREGDHTCHSVGLPKPGDTKSCYCP
ncbi:MAG: hypothetical protein HC853_01350 [Anaerolineae bacterium]|nr:hypothetical protein [Anaerolineae bacterium]